MGPEVIVPVMFFVIVVGLPITAVIITRVLGHQERMEMIRRGFMPPPDPGMMRKAMKYGAAYNWQQPPQGAPMPGAMPPPGMVPNGYVPEYYAQHQLRRGIQVACIGLALLIGLSFIGMHGAHFFGPWLLGGLIPMFVGVAQIISAVLSGAKIGVAPGTMGVGAGQAQWGPRDTTADMPPAGAGATTTTTGNMPPPPSYGGWRPGPTPEIGKPPSPPDYHG